MSDLALERRLANEGYVVVALLDPDGVAAVKRVIDGLGPAPGDPGHGLFNDSWSTDTAYKRALSDGLDNIFAPVIDALFVDHTPLIWGTSVKYPGTEGSVAAHRDPTFVDEERFRSVGVWCALNDVAEEDGTLEILPRSHRSETTIRVHQSEGNLYPDIDLNSRDLLRSVRLQAGSAIIYDHSLIHRSGPNLRTRPRVVAMSHLVPVAARSTYAVPLDETTAAVIEAGSDFYLEHQVNHLDIPQVISSHRIISTIPVTGGPGSFPTPRGFNRLRGRFRAEDVQPDR